MRYLLLLGFLAACSDAYDDTKKVDTIEAWDKFLATNPTGSRLLGAQDRLEELLSTRADSSKKLEDYDVLIKRFPKSRNLKKYQTARVGIAMTEAEAANTPEAWKKFETENPYADPALRKRAEALIA